MHRTLITIEQVEDDGICTTIVNGERDGYFCFKEEFINKDNAVGMHLYSEKEISRYDAARAVSLDCLGKLLDKIKNSVKTAGICGIEPNGVTFDLGVLPTIRHFERITNVQFDYSKFKNQREFQRYIQGLIRQ